MRTVLVVNSGSSSIKYQLIDPGSGERLASGLIERIGQGAARSAHRHGESTSEREVSAADHTEAFREIVRSFEAAGSPLIELGVAAVGHRVVQGGSDFVGPTVIDDAVAQRIVDLSELAPLHNPAHAQAIDAARRLLPDVPHIAVFDTAFHQTLPPDAYTYAVDPEVADQYGVRRYGFHGTSHQVVSQRAADLLGRPLTELRQIVLHLGNGASACAIDGGLSVDTSMGLTPLEGLVMGSRSGDIDPGAILHLLRSGMDADDIDALLNQRSGLRGLSGSVDMRDVQQSAADGDERAALALRIYGRRIRHYLGAYLVELGGADTIVFTAGVGENVAAVRADVCRDLEWFGIRLDPERNASRTPGARLISADDSRVAVLVVPTDEEAEIARQAWEVVAR